ncbi:caspase family protein [Bosea sp. PAMC 26642]|uniref:caspase family protein n=1 Tax=Bosea sp. (strain PAMC 26642) TaxID=1792307 RepID=UPI00143A089D|nr:caspase family protein [Bosea sp. PAMC 26642]
MPALPNTANDASDLAEALRSNGFVVFEAQKLNRRAMREALTAQAATVRSPPHLWSSSVSLDWR